MEININYACQLARREKKILLITPDSAHTSSKTETQTANLDHSPQKRQDTSAAVLTLDLDSLGPALVADTEGDLLEEAKDFFGMDEGVLWEEGLTLLLGFLGVFI